MNILILNGSPKGTQSNTMAITNAFMQGVCDGNTHEINTILIHKQNIKPCTGCFGCWSVSPGACVLHDDMTPLLAMYRKADAVIWSFPLYYFGMPSGIKAFMDRLMPNNLPAIIENEEGGARHPQAFDDSKQKHVLISTCGFHTIKDNYEALVQQFTMVFRDRASFILCPEGGVFSMGRQSRPVREYLHQARKAGEEFAKTNTLSATTQNALSEPIFDPDLYSRAVNLLSWGPTTDTAPEKTEPITPDTRKGIQDFASTFFSAMPEEPPLVVEIYLSDLGNTFQLDIVDGACRVLEQEFKAFTTRLEMPFAVWQQITEKQLSLSKAFVDKLYTVKGDFNTILCFDDLFPIVP